MFDFGTLADRDVDLLVRQMIVRSLVPLDQDEARARADLDQMARVNRKTRRSDPALDSGCRGFTRREDDSLAAHGQRAIERIERALPFSPYAGRGPG